VRLLAAAISLSIALPAASQLRANRRPPRPEVTLPDGPVRQVILKNCTQCHGIDEYGFYAMPRERWEAVIERMKTAKSGVVEGTSISDADTEILLDWLVAEFGPDATPMRREYVIPELTTAERLSDAQAQATLESVCQDCHGLGRINEADFDAAQWRERVTRELSRGAALLIEDVEPLVQWLANSD
jgi:mono/diheme cytochrome c family protein